MSNSIFIEALSTAAFETNLHLEKLLPQTRQGKVASAMRYAVLNGGKRLRAFLSLQSGALFGASKIQSLQTASVIELIHAYSLVHDDMPAIDNDDLRRGKPTIHIKWDEATAILTGDGLQSLAYEVLAQEDTHPEAQIRISLISELAKSSGLLGMIGGQELDIEAGKLNKPLNIEETKNLQKLKTGALFGWSLQSGAILTNQDSTSISEFADALGLAFQIKDDILDVEGESDQTGKRLRKDSNAGKSTLVSQLGINESKKMAKSLYTQACDALAPYGQKADLLKSAALFAIERKS